LYKGIVIINYINLQNFFTLIFFFYRPQINLDDLVNIAEHLLNSKVIGYEQEVTLKPLAKAYSNFEKYGQTLSNFYGLRDYYALDK
jgi:hypothetical protein